MISFVWAHDIPVYSGRGGTETYTVGHIRALKDRGIPARIITIGLGKKDGRKYFKDIEFLSLKSAEELETLDDTIVHISLPLAIRTKHPSYTILHSPPVDVLLHMKHADIVRGASYNTLITTSRFMRGLWADYLNIGLDKIHVVYPFADPHFASVKRRKRLKGSPTRVLYAGRLLHEKGIYLVLEALHHRILRKGFTFTVTNAGNQTKDGKVIERILRWHPWIRVIPARHTPAEMARLMANYDVVIVPSNHRYWHEAFGMVSVEAQHAGCRVVASGADGLPETNCGELLLFNPGDSYSLATSIQRAVDYGPVHTAERQQAAKHFTLKESVDALLTVVKPEE